MCSSLKQEMENSGPSLALISEFPTETLSTKSLFCSCQLANLRALCARLLTAEEELSSLPAAPASSLNKAGFHSA